jgi:signal transduction histidine kinase
VQPALPATPDLMGHSLALARIQLDAVPAASSKTETTLLTKDISRILLKAIQDTKNLMFELSSPSMNEIGLGAAISELLEEQIEKRYRLETEFIDDIGDSHREVLDENTRAILFRNVRELLINVIKHAQARKVSVFMDVADAVFKIVVKDDGIGFNPEDVYRGANQEVKFGLFSIQERMTHLDGSLEIVSEPGKGCKAILTVPLGTDPV